MRLKAILLALFFSAHLAESIRLPSFIQNVLGIGQPSTTSTIPQFILDTEHPWLRWNKGWLSRYPNVAEAICDKTSSLWQHPRSNASRLPDDLFHKLEIDNNRAGISRLGWQNAADRLAELQKCPAALHDVRHLHLDIYPHDSKYSDYAEPSLPPAELPGLMAEVLDSMISLDRLDFGVTGRSSSLFEKAFVEANTTLPSVNHLIPGAYSDWILSCCPNIETVVAGSFFHHGSWNDYDPEWRPTTNKYDSLIEAMRDLPIKKLNLFAGGWTLERVQNILQAAPNLTSLEIEGPLNEYNRMRVPPGEALLRYLSHLAQFEYLEELHLPDSSDLDLGFDGGHWCGNAYDGKEGRAYGRAVMRERAGTTERAAIMVREALPRLWNFSIGAAAPNITKIEDSTIEMRWPWTGRLNEYTYEVWGPPEGNEDERWSWAVEDEDDW